MAGERPKRDNCIGLAFDPHGDEYRFHRPLPTRWPPAHAAGPAPGEAPLDAAKRELEEETGYTAREWRLIGKSAPNPAFQTNTLHSYLALDAELTAAVRPDGDEVIEVSTEPLGRVQELMRRGVIDHALVLVAFAHLALQVGELHRPPPR